MFTSIFFIYAIKNAYDKKLFEDECFFSSEIDKECQRTYAANFGERPSGDITIIPNSKVPKHDVLLAGFPCQPFSIIGDGKGFRDNINGTLFFEIARILKAKRPVAFVLENVKRLVGHHGGETFIFLWWVVKEAGVNGVFLAAIPMRKIYFPGKL